jgi:hypothetical protein
MCCLDDALWLLPPGDEFAALGMGDLATSYFDLGMQCEVLQLKNENGDLTRAAAAIIPRFDREN